MINKISSDLSKAIGHVSDGDTVLVSGFGHAGAPELLIQALVEHGAKELTIVSNGAGGQGWGISSLIRSRQVRKLICSYPRSTHDGAFEQLYRTGDIELELVPQGTLAERLRAAGAGIGAFYCRTSVGTMLGEGKEAREIAGVPHVLEYPIRGDVALVQAACADRWGNLTYAQSARNFAPVMAAAATFTVACVEQVVELGKLDPECMAGVV